MTLLIITGVVIAAYLITHAIIRLDRGPERREIHRQSFSEVDGAALIQALKRRVK